MVIWDLLRVDRKVQNPLELVSYLFPFGPTPSHILKSNWNGSKRLAQFDNQLQGKKHTKFYIE